MSSGYRVPGINDMYFDWNEGLLANKPAVLARGRFFLATDEGKIYYGKADGSQGIISVTGGGGQHFVTSVTASIGTSGEDYVVNVANNSSTQKVEVAKAGSLTGQARKQINFVEGSGISITAADNAGSDRTDVTIAATGSGAGDMLKSRYDANDDGRVGAADTVSDGSNTVTAAQAKGAVDKSHDKLHNLNDATSHTGITGTTGNLMALDSNGLPVDSTKKPSDFAAVGHSHASSDVSDFTEAAQDAVGNMFQNSSSVTFTYNDASNTISAAVVSESTIGKVGVLKNGNLSSTSSILNFIEGAGITINTAVGIDPRIADITIAATGGGGGTGDMLKSTYDTDNDGRVESADAISDGSNTVTAAQAQAAVNNSHGRSHNLASTSDHSGIAGTSGNFMSLNASGLPADSGYKPSDFLTGAHTQTASTITDFNEAAQDAVGAALASSSTVTPTYNDAGNTISMAVIADSVVEKLEIAASSTLVGTRKRLNFLQGANVTLTVTDDSVNNKVDVLIAASAGAGGSNYEVYVDTYGVHKDGATDDAVHLQSAITGLGATKCTLVITKGTYLISSQSLSFPDSMRLQFENGANFKIESGRTVTMYAPIAGFTQIFSGTNLANVHIQGACDAYLPSWWGLNDQGAAASNTTAMQAAIDMAQTAYNDHGSAPKILVPAGHFDLNTVNVKQVAVEGMGSQQTIFHLQSSPVFDLAGNDNYSLKGFKIIGSGSGTGIRGGAISNGANRFWMEDIYCYNLAYGIDITGWIGDMRNIWANTCSVGLRGQTLNGVRLNFQAESCTTALILNNSSGVIIDGGCIENCTTGISIDDDDAFSASDTSQGIVISGHYQEANTVGIRIGTQMASYNHNIIIEGGKFTGNWSNGMINDMNFDYVNGLRIVNAFISCPINIMNHARDVKVDSSPEYYTASATTRASWIRSATKNQKRIENFIPNPYFRTPLRGFTTVGYANATGAATSDEAEKMNGGGWKISATGGGAGVNMELRIPDIAADQLQGKRAIVSGWMYVSTDTDFNWSGFSNPVAQPQILVSYYVGGVETTSTGYASQAGFRQGYWNFFMTELDIPASVDWMKVYVCVNKNGSGTPSAGTYVVVSGLCLCEAPVVIGELMNGQWVQHPYAGVEVGPNMILYGSAAPAADADQNWQVGDKVINTAPSAAGVAEWVCTAGGGTPTWTALTLS
ncbi:MAG: hypothetical protein ACM3QX_18240 [Syntrophomonadaceae bacterium]